MPTLPQRSRVAAFSKLPSTLTDKGSDPVGTLCGIPPITGEGWDLRGSQGLTGEHWNNCWLGRALNSASYRRIKVKLPLTVVKRLARKMTYGELAQSSNNNGVRICMLMRLTTSVNKRQLSLKLGTVALRETIANRDCDILTRKPSVARLVNMPPMVRRISNGTLSMTKPTVVVLPSRRTLKARRSLAV
ncbi:hypothetical protein VTK56DRAFT_7122 [Thermocarpiscus australiensis]